MLITDINEDIIKKSIQGDPESSTILLEYYSHDWDYVEPEGITVKQIKGINFRNAIMKFYPEIEKQLYKKYITVNCCFHDDTNPSMAIYDNNFICYACGKKGDIIEFYKLKYPELNFYQILNKIWVDNNGNTE